VHFPTMPVASGQPNPLRSSIKPEQPAQKRDGQFDPFNTRG
jgi:hypothetical protein